MSPYVYDQTTVGKYTVRVVEDPDNGAYYDGVEDFFGEGVQFYICNNRYRNHLTERIFEDLIKAKKVGEVQLFSVDVYEHSGFAFSLSGEGTQCRFDTARGGALLVWNKQITGNELSRENARGLLEHITDFWNGAFVGWEVFEGDDEDEVIESCWAYLACCADDALADGIATAKNYHNADMREEERLALSCAGTD